MGPRTSLGAFGKGTVLGLLEITPRFPGRPPRTQTSQSRATDFYALK
jgi:hypothetical protein